MTIGPRANDPWQLPIFIMMAMLGVLTVLTKGSAAAPFIYTIF